MTFADVVMYCYDNDELVENYCRLTGHWTLKPKPPRNGLEKLIDEATGYGATTDEKEALHFIAFVRGCVWDRLPTEAFQP